MVSKGKRHHQQQNLSSNKQIAISSPMQFTLLEIKMLKDAVAQFEQTSLSRNQSLPNIDFAREVVEGLKQKLDDLLQQEDWKKKVPLDYNETFLLVSTLHMYLLELKITGNNALIPHCTKLCTQFLALAEYADSIKQQRILRL
jgi:hypothetical protein